MKIKQIYSLAILLLTTGVYFAQIGINTPNPQTTLDIVGNGASTSSKDGVTAPRLTRQQLAAKTAGTYTAAQLGAMVYVTDATTPTGTTPSLAQTVEITTPGYYFFNGTVWKNVNDGALNIYNSNGTLADNRVVTTAGNQLNFNGPNSSVIVATATTEGRVSIAGSARASVGLTSGTSVLNLFQDSGNLAQITTTGASTGLNLTTTNATPLNFLTSGIGRMTITSGGNVGIGTTAATNKLHINATNPVRLEGLQESSGTSGSLTVNSTGVVQLQNSSSISAVRATGNITITVNNTFTNTGAATETFDNLNEFAGNTFTAAATGLYKVDFRINFPQRPGSEDSGDGYLGTTNVILNGTVYSSASTKITLPEISGAAATNSCTDSVLVKMNAGNTLAFQGSSYGSTVNAGNPITASYVITITRID